MINESAGLKAGAISAAFAWLNGIHNIVAILIIGTIGGIAYIGKEIALMEEPPTLQKVLRLPFTAFMAIGMTGFVYYAGTDGFNVYVKDIGHPMWIFLSFMAAMNYQIIINKAGEAFSTALKYFGRKKDE